MRITIIPRIAARTPALIATAWPARADDQSVMPEHIAMMAASSRGFGGLSASLAIAGMAVATFLGTAPIARANAYQDQEFYRLLTEPDQDYPMTVWDFPLVRSQGIEACEREDAGVPPYQSLKELEYPTGPYTFDIANNIVSAAEVIYCPWHSSQGSGDSNRVNVSAPVYPPPIYPPLEWYPPQSGYSPAPGGA